MTKHTDYETGTKEVRVRVSPQAMKIIKRMVQRETRFNGVTIATLAGRILTEAVIGKEIEARQQEAAAAVKKVREVAPATPLELFFRGNTLSQIATILRMPYAKVAEEIGLGVDKIVERRAGPSPFNEEHARNVINGDV